MNYNGGRHLEKCVESLLNQSSRGFSILIVDDYSTDESVDSVKSRFPQVEVIENQSNMGFAESANKAIKHSLEKHFPDYIALINNDAVAEKDWLKNLVDTIKKRGGVAAVSSNMLCLDDPSTIDSQGVTCTKTGMGYGVNYGVDSARARPPSRVLAACWGAVLLDSEKLGETGLLDPRYFAYLEDLDWGWRANLLGYDILFAENALVYHKSGAAFKRMQWKKNYLCFRNSLTTILKNYGASKLLACLPLKLFEGARFSLGCLINRKACGRFPDVQLVPALPGEPTAPERFRCALVPAAAFLWNIINLKKTLLLRRKTQARRRRGDGEIMSLMM